MEIYNIKCFCVIGLCPAGWSHYIDACYLHRNKSSGLTWVEAEKDCVDLGGHLVSIQSRQELQYVHYMLNTKWKSSEENVFIGECGQEYCNS